jgi:hypothetical protein
VKVIHVIPAYPPTDFFTGPPHQLHRLARALRAGGVDIRVITTNSNGPNTLNVATDRWTDFDGVPVSTAIVKRESATSRGTRGARSSARAARRISSTSRGSFLGPISQPRRSPAGSGSPSSRPAAVSILTPSSSALEKRRCISDSEAIGPSGRLRRFT